MVSVSSLQKTEITMGAPVGALIAGTFAQWILSGFTSQTKNLYTQMLYVFAEADHAVLTPLAQDLLAFMKSEPDELNTIWTSAFGLGTESITPCESVLRTGLVMQEPRDQTLAWMRRIGKLPQDEIREPEDHLGLQLFVLETILAGSLEKTDLFDVAREFASERLVWIGALHDALAEKGTSDLILKSLDFLVLSLRNCGLPVA